MTKLQYYTAASLDGFIADEHHSLDWLYDVPHDGEGTWDAFIGSVGPMVMGATTYQWAFDHGDFGTNPAQWREFYDDRPCWVFTHHDLPPIPGVDIRFVSGDVRPVYDEMVATRPGNIWLVGGGELVGQFDDAGLLDEIHIHLTPVILGGGAPLLPRRITSDRLSFREGAVSGQRLNVVLDVRRQEGAESASSK
jgi:dihydrofolate reductase